MFIGILGGMGPAATASLYLRIIGRFQQQGSVLDDEFPEILIISLPIPDVVASPEDLRRAEAMLIDACVRLERAGASFIAVPCNTVMRFIGSMRASVTIPVISIVEETVRAVNASSLSCVGVLGTKMTLESGLYGGLRMPQVVPTTEEQRQLTAAILDILAGRGDVALLQEIVRAMLFRGAQKVILGCTELPLVLSGDEVIDTLDILADAVVQEVLSS